MVATRPLVTFFCLAFVVVCLFLLGKGQIIIFEKLENTEKQINLPEQF